MAQLDAMVEGQRSANAAPGRKALFEDKHLCDRLPSEYWQTNGFVGASLLSLPEMEHRHDIGVGTMMYGNDYPHPEGTWGRQTSWLQASLGKAGGTEDEARRILGLNAADLYHFDVAPLQEVANNEIGPTVDDVLHDLSDDEVTALLTEASGSGRVLAASHLRGLGASA
jgi:hypothetical protein